MRNALKHGLFAEEIVVTRGDGSERLAEFRSLLSQLEQEHEPVGYPSGSGVGGELPEHW